MSNTIEDYTEKRLEEFDEMKKGFLAVRQGEWWASDEDFIKSFITESIAQARAEERDRVRGRIENAIKYTNWSHSVGSHSDDRGGDSDIECICREDEAKYKTEAYKNTLSFLASLDKLTAIKLKGDNDE